MALVPAAWKTRSTERTAWCRACVIASRACTTAASRSLSPRHARVHRSPTATCTYARAELRIASASATRVCTSARSRNGAVDMVAKGVGRRRRRRAAGRQACEQAQEARRTQNPSTHVADQKVCASPGCDRCYARSRALDRAVSRPFAWEHPQALDPHLRLPHGWPLASSRTAAAKYLSRVAQRMPRRASIALRQILRSTPRRPSSAGDYICRRPRPGQPVGDGCWGGRPAFASPKSAGSRTDRAPYAGTSIISPWGCWRRPDRRRVSRDSGLPRNSPLPVQNSKCRHRPSVVG
jgi:hypothetical protein